MLAEIVHLRRRAEAAEASIGSGLWRQGIRGIAVLVCGGIAALKRLSASNYLDINTTSSTAQLEGVT